MLEDDDFLQFDPQPEADDQFEDDYLRDILKRSSEKPRSAPPDPS